MHYINKKKDIDQPCVCMNKSLHEDLGRVKMIFTDKTGTITENKLEFFSCIIGDKIYNTE